MSRLRLVTTRVAMHSASRTVLSHPRSRCPQIAFAAVLTESRQSDESSDLLVRYGAELGKVKHDYIATLGQRRDACIRFANRGNPASTSVMGLAYSPGTGRCRCSTARSRSPIASAQVESYAAMTRRPPEALSM